MKKVSKVPRSPLHIFILGTPGSGKATQARILAKKYRLYDLDMGVEQLQQRRRDKKLDALFKKTVDIGKMNPTRTYRLLLVNALKRIPIKQGILFDGHPKMPNEVKFLSKLLRKLSRTKCVCIYLEVPWAESVRRNRLRKGYFDKEQRPDDSEPALRRRYYNARSLIKESKTVYRSLFPMATVSGVGTVEEVSARVGVAMKKLLKYYDEKRAD